MKTLLLADADRDSRTVYRLLLQHAGYTVLEAGDANSALTTARQHRPDLLITELVLPGADGVSLLEAVLRTPELTRLRRMVLTTNQGERLAARCLELGAVSVLYKPIHPTALVAEVARVLEPAVASG